MYGLVTLVYSLLHYLSGPPHTQVMYESVCVCVWGGGEYPTSLSVYMQYFIST